MEFEYSEVLLAEVLGMPRDNLQKIRMADPGTTSSERCHKKPQAHRAPLRIGEDWELYHNEVRYVRPGVLKLLKLLGLDLPKKKPRHAGGQTIEEVLIASSRAYRGPTHCVVPWRPQDQHLVVLNITRNSHILMATFQDGALAPKGKKYQGREKKYTREGDLLFPVRVFVRSNKNFIPGMKILCRHRERDLWDLVGRCPRSRGRAAI